MATNPLISQGTINRLMAAVHLVNFPELNVTSPFMGRRFVSLALDGDISTFINTATGMVLSPEPYMPATITIHMLRTQGLALAWRNQFVTGSGIGNVTVYPDTTTLLPFDFYNCGIRRLEALNLDGSNADFVIQLYGTYYINNDMWNQFTPLAA
jgi:hypothetical protein